MAPEFSTKQVGSHYKLIAFDRAVRAMVEGGQSVLLTDQDQFTFLYSVFLLPDGIQGSGGGRSAAGEPRGLKEHSSEVCQ